MADGKHINITINTVAGQSTSVKKMLDGHINDWKAHGRKLEQEVASSGKRIEQSHKSTEKVIADSERKLTQVSVREAKARANAFLNSLKEMQAGAKAHQSKIEQAISGSASSALKGGFVGGFFGAITAQITQLPAVFKQSVEEMVQIAAARQNAFKGLEGISKFVGLNDGEAQAAVKNLRLVKSGIVDIGEASIALKNLLSSGFSLPESIKLLEAFSDTAAFGKSAALGFGEAIRGATEGIRNGNSILVDNVGLTKNLSIILKEAGFAEKDLMKVKDDVNVRQALFNGLIKEAIPQMGDANRLTEGWTGNTSALTTAQNNLYAAIGDVIINNEALLAVMGTLTMEMNSFTTNVNTAESTWRTATRNMTTAFAEFVLSVDIGIQKEIADIRELINVIEIAAYGLASLGTDLGTGWTTAGAERLKAYQDAKAKSGTFYNSAQQYENRARADYLNRLGGGKKNPNLLPVTAPTFYRRNEQPSGQFIDIMTGRPTSNLTSIRPGSTSSATDPSSPGGRGRVRAATNTDQRKVDELEKFVIEQGWKPGSGVRTKGTTGIHATGRALDVGMNSNDKKTADEIGQFVAAAIQKGFRVVDERVKIAGSPHWTAPHLHIEANDRRESTLNPRLGYGNIPTGYLRELDDKRFAKANVSKDEIAKFMKDAVSIAFNKDGTLSISAPLTTTETPDGLGEGLYTRSERELPRIETQISLYREMSDAIFEMNEHSREEVFLRKVLLGDYPELNKERVDEIANMYRLLDGIEKKSKAEKEAAEFEKAVASELEQIKRDEYNKTRGLIEESIDLLSQGDIKGLGRAWMERQRQNFVTNATDWVMETLGLENPDDTPELKEAKRQTKLLEVIAGQKAGIKIPGTNITMPNILGGGGGLGSNIFGGGYTPTPTFPTVGPGGTPNFNPNTGNGGLGPFLGSLFGGAPNPNFGAGGGNTNAQSGGLGGFLSGLFNRGARGVPRLNGVPMIVGKTASGRQILNPDVVPVAGRTGGGLGGLFGGMFKPQTNPITGKTNSNLAGAMGGIGSIMSMVGSFIPGRAGGILSMAGTGMSIGSMFGPWGAAIGAGVGALIGIFQGRSKAEKELRAAAESQFGLNVKDKSVLKRLKAVGEGMFGQGKVDKSNAVAVVRSEEGMNILRAYAESSGQSGLKIDRLNMADPNWSGNQFRSKFGGFREHGGPVKAGYSYVVGEKRAELFTPTTDGHISPSVPSGGKSDMHVAEAMYRIADELARIKTMSADQVLVMGSQTRQGQQAVYEATNREWSTGGRRSERTARVTGGIR